MKGFGSSLVLVLYDDFKMIFTKAVGVKHWLLFFKFIK